MDLEVCDVLGIYEEFKFSSVINISNVEEVHKQYLKTDGFSHFILAKVGTKLVGLLKKLNSHKIW